MRVFKKGLIIILAGIFTVPAAFTQNIQVEQDKTIGGNLIDAPSAVMADPQGGMWLLAGSESGIGFDKTVPTFGSYDFWLIKLNELLQIEWQKGWGGNQLETEGWITDFSGSLYLGGGTMSNISGNKIVPSLTGDSLWTDYWLIKMDYSGNEIWQKVFGGTKDDVLSKILTINNQLLLCGLSSSDISFDKGENSKGFRDFWVLAIDSSGNKIWDKTIGSSGDEFNSNFSLDTDGNILAVTYGNSGIGGDKTVPLFGDPNQSSDIWLVKLSPTGQKIWDIGLGGTAIEQTPRILAHGGFYYVVCASNSPVSGNKTASNIGNDDIWVVKLDTAGNIIWDKTYGGTGTDWFPEVSVNSLGQLVVVCSSGSGISGNKTEASKGGSDYWVFALNAEGELQWQKTIGGSGNESPGCPVLELPDNRYAVFGYSLSGISGDKTESNRGGGDIWGVILQTDLSTNQTDWEAGVNLYPVPAQNRVTIDITNAEQFSSPYTVELTDVNGRIVWNCLYPCLPAVVDVSNLNQGIYFVSVQNAHGTVSIGKIMVAR